VFVGDNILGAIIALNFVAVANMRVEFSDRASRLIKLFSSYTFSIYFSTCPSSPSCWGVLGLHSALLVVPFLAVSIVALGSLTERQLPRWRVLASYLWSVAGHRESPLAVQSVGVDGDTGNPARPLRVRL
jgi:hypothetical protein